MTELEFVEYNIIAELKITFPRYNFCILTKKLERKSYRIDLFAGIKAIEYKEKIKG